VGTLTADATSSVGFGEVSPVAASWPQHVAESDASKMPINIGRSEFEREKGSQRFTLITRALFN
jgi:hypothetical protein